MEFLLWFTEGHGGPPPTRDGMAEMTRFAAELARQGKLRLGAPLAPHRDGALVRVREGKTLIHDGPFAESKELVAGFWIIDVAGRDEALEIAGRCPHARRGTVEVRAIQHRYAYRDLGKDTPFLMVFRVDPGLTDPEGAKLREMIAFGEALPDGTLVETAPLTGDPLPARVRVRGGEALVTDGPFAEAKESVGGYAVVRVASRAAAVDLATRYPHARWGAVEVREILFFDPV